MKLFITLAAGALSAAAAQALPKADHVYEFSSSFADARGGPAAINNGGTFTGTGPSAGLVFGPNQGPAFTNVLANPGTYSIELFFEFDVTSGYRKIVDFKDRSTHNGLYVNSGVLTLFGTSAAGGSLAPNSFAHLVLTRDAASKQMVAYLNGTQVFSLIDTGNVGTFSAAANIVHLLRDDGRGGGGENSPGTVDFVRFYDGAITAGTVAELYNNGDPLRTGVPEPATWAMMIGGFGLAGAAARRKARQTAQAAA